MKTLNEAIACSRCGCQGFGGKKAWSSMVQHVHGRAGQYVAEDEKPGGYEDNKLRCINAWLHVQMVRTDGGGDPLIPVLRYDVGVKIAEDNKALRARRLAEERAQGPGK